MAEWSELPRDMLALITSYFGIPDTRRFSSVCRNWRSYTKENRNIPIPQLPWLVLADDENSGKRRIFNMSENKHYHFDIPELRGAFIVGSSFGWLFVFAVSSRTDAYSVNPLSRATISLPSLPPLCYGDHELCLYCEECTPQNLTDESLIERDQDGRLITPRCGVRNAMLSADPTNCTDLLVMIVLGGSHTKVAFHKSGHSTWKVLNTRSGVYDMIFFKGQTYALLANNMLATFDVGPEPKIIEEKWLGREYCYSEYLVDYLGEHIFVVYRDLASDANDDDHLTTKGFRVFKVDNSRPRPRPRARLYPVKSLEGHAIFWG